MCYYYNIEPAVSDYDTQQFVFIYLCSSRTLVAGSMGGHLVMIERPGEDDTI